MQLPVPATVAAMADHLAGGRLHRAPLASMATSAAERNRPGSDQLISSWAALMGPIPGSESRVGAMAVTRWRSSPSSWWAS